MERDVFLKACQKVSMLKDGISGIKQNVPNELLVKAKNIIYYPLKFEISFKKGEPQNIAILHDLKSNSTVSVNLEKVAEHDA